MERKANQCDRDTGCEKETMCVQGAGRLLPLPHRSRWGEGWGEGGRLSFRCAPVQRWVTPGVPAFPLRVFHVFVMNFLAFTAAT
jgi:hypothetical protein